MMPTTPSGCGTTFTRARQQPFVGAAALRFHPPFAVAQGRVDFLFHQQEFCEQHFLFRTIAEVGAHRVGERVAIIEQHFAQRLQMRRARSTTDTARANTHDADRQAALAARRPRADRSS